MMKKGIVSLGIATCLLGLPAASITIGGCSSIDNVFSTQVTHENAEKTLYTTGVSLKVTVYAVTLAVNSDLLTSAQGQELADQLSFAQVLLDHANAVIGEGGDANEMLDRAIEIINEVQDDDVIREVM